MSALLIGMLGILLVPLFVASWRLSLLALAGQGLIMSWIGFQLDPGLHHADTWLSLADLLLLRALGAPLVLYLVLRARHALPRADVQPPSLMSWTVAVAAVLISFRFAELMVPAYEPSADQTQTFVAAATASLLLGFSLLATQTGPFSQMVGVLRIENAIALFELGLAAQPTRVGLDGELLELGARHGQPLALSAAQTAMLVLTLLLFRWYLANLPVPPPGKRSVLEAQRP